MGEGDVDPIGVIAKTLAWAALVAVAFIEIAFFDGSWDMGDVLHAIGPAWDSQTVRHRGRFTVQAERRQRPALVSRR